MTLPTLPSSVLDLIAQDHPEAVASYRREHGLPTAPAPEQDAPPDTPTPTAAQERARKRTRTS